MPKSKQEKQKDRERRVAKEKLASAAHRKSVEKSAAESGSGVSSMAKKVANQQPAKPQNAPAVNRSSFTHRRTGGGK